MGKHKFSVYWNLTDLNTKENSHIWKPGFGVWQSPKHERFPISNNTKLLLTFQGSATLSIAYPTYQILRGVWYCYIQLLNGYMSRPSATNLRPVLLTSLNIPTLISNYMLSNLWCEITYPFPNFNGCTVEVWEWISNFIPHSVMDVISSPCWDYS